MARWLDARGQHGVAVASKGQWYDALPLMREGSFWGDFDSEEKYSHALQTGSDAAIACIPWLSARLGDPSGLPPPLDGAEVASRLCAPIWGKGIIYGAAVNYRSHAAESRMQVPDAPLFFIKPFRCIVGPNEDVELPAYSSQPDYEAELAVVVGKRGKRIPAGIALEHVAGYTILNDVSFRDLQRREVPGRQVTMDWVSGKALDSAAPLGPWIVTGDEVGDPQNLDIRLSIDGELRQSGSTADMVFPVAELISHLSRDITLEPGDVIATGTCSGVGRSSGVFLQGGNHIDISVARVGTLSHGVRNPSVAISGHR